MTPINFRRAVLLLALMLLGTQSLWAMDHKFAKENPNQRPGAFSGGIVAEAPTALKSETSKPAADSKPTGLAWTLPDGVRVLLTSYPDLHSRKMLTLSLQWQGESPWEPVAFDAEMPEHKHGMVVAASKPQQRDPKLPTYEVQGVKLHMAGLWLLKLEIRHKSTGETRWIQVPFHLKI